MLENKGGNGRLRTAQARTEFSNSQLTLIVTLAAMDVKLAAFVESVDKRAPADVGWTAVVAAVGATAGQILKERQARQEELILLAEEAAKKGPEKAAKTEPPPRIPAAEIPSLEPKQDPVGEPKAGKPGE
ncbi:MAG TPA: hypothetical protein VJU16_05155 [Planctomycetota bacterium]|nr:hypothetical protein [Planctomycetota bacterium]